MPELYYLCFSNLFCPLVLLLSPLISAGFLYSARRVELGSTIIVFARLELKSFTLVLVLLLSFENLCKAIYLVVEKLILN